MSSQPQNDASRKPDRIAAVANAVAYDSRRMAREYVRGAPHIKHPSLRKLYGQLVVEVYDFSAKYSKNPRVLDLGAGEGSVTLPFLELGARVTAVDASESQLALLAAACKRFQDKLEIVHADINDFLASSAGSYDIVVANSFLHHLPDYLTAITRAAPRLAPHGQFFFFQDPLRYDTLGSCTKVFSKAAYLSWRIFGGDIIGGTKRYLRRRRGIYRDDCEEDNVEYHVVRNGVDQDAIIQLLNSLGFESRVIRYFSTQNPLFQFLGERLGIKNTFGVLARKTE